MTKQILSDIFKDPFYYGKLIQANQKVNLKDIYDFKPAITETDYIEVQGLSNIRKQPYKRTRIAYYPLKMMITCAFCKNHMYAGASKSSSGKRYLFYRCDNRFCTRKKKSIRAIIIFKFIYKFTQRGLSFTEKEYQQYLSSLKSVSGLKREKTQMELHSQQGKLKSIEREIQDISYKILDFEKDSIVRSVNERRLNELQDVQERTKASILKIKEMIGDPSQEAVSYEQFLNLSKNAGMTIKMGDSVVKDAICRLIFLSFTVDEEKVLSYQLKPPFDELLNVRSVKSSRG